MRPRKWRTRRDQAHPPAALSAFHVSIDPGTEGGDERGSSGAGTNEGVARLEGNSSNALFETLQDWEHQLKHSEIDFKAISQKPKGPQL